MGVDGLVGHHLMVTLAGSLMVNGWLTEVKANINEHISHLMELHNSYVEPFKDTKVYCKHT